MYKSSQDIAWKEELTERDKHDMDLEGDRIYVVPMEKDYYENGQKVSDDGAYVYNRTQSLGNGTSEITTIRQTKIQELDGHT